MTLIFDNELAGTLHGTVNVELLTLLYTLLLSLKNQEHSVAAEFTKS